MFVCLITCFYVCLSFPWSVGSRTPNGRCAFVVVVVVGVVVVCLVVAVMGVTDLVAVVQK